jgi:hypothetical protein
VTLFQVGDRVRVRPRVGDKPWHTSNGHAYWQECKPGEVGTVTYHGGGPVSVRWDSGRTSSIDPECIEHDGRTEEAMLDQEILLLLGIEKKKHCKTCTCED